MSSPNKRPFNIEPRVVTNRINNRLADLAYVFVAYNDGSYEHLMASDHILTDPSEEPPISPQIAYVPLPSSSGGESGGSADPCIYYNFGGGWEKICW